ncbi:MAG: DEAD/DEAH box helicase [Atopostipes suicloacalis]|nr:DEAD/DEAH box helicase [Atopostipes suicloacalis]
MTNNFKQFNLEDYLLDAIEELHFKNPTPIQTRVINQIQSKEDIIAQSKTGSGKTHAFLLPLLNQLKEGKDEVQIVITAPSRELAEQLYKAASQLTEKAPWDIDIARFVGGRDKNKQIESLEKSQPDVAIGTPGRILDLMSSNHLLTYTAFAMVIDEADMTLDLGFIEQVDKIAGTLSEDSQLLVFSATIPQKLQPFLQKYMNSPVTIEVKNDEVISDLIENILISTKGKDRIELIYDIVTLGHPYLVLVFANTQDKVEYLANELEEKGLNVGVLHGGLESRERRRVMREIRQLDYQFVVATDLAARGIDIEGVSHVINAEVPQDLSYFVHRVGRTGRNNLPGIAITLYSPGEEKDIQIIEDMGIKFEEKTLRNDRLVDVRQRRAERKRPNAGLEYDGQIEGMAHKAKKNIKPGYKRKLRQKRKKKEQQKRRFNSKKKR